MTEAVNRRPVLITVQAELDQLRQEREEIAELLLGLKQDLFEMQRTLRSGDPGGAKDSARSLNDVKYWLKSAKETEKEIESLRRKDSAIVGEYGLDLEQAALDIGCRMARLRSCCGEGEVSE